MKIVLILSLLLAFTACSKNKPKTYICFNPFMPIQSIQADTDSEGVRERETTLELKTDRGDLIVMPKSLCVEFRKAE